MTSLPAGIVGFRDRGRIANNLPADLVLFDKDTVTDHATLDQPRARATGIRATFVNGQPVIHDGRFTGALRAAYSAGPRRDIRAAHPKPPPAEPGRRLPRVRDPGERLFRRADQGPPKPGESDYDASGAYPGGVPCTSSRMWPLVDLGLMLWVLALTVNYDNRDDQIDGSLTAAAAAISTLIGYRRTKACRDAQAAATAAPAALPR